MDDVIFQPLKFRSLTIKNRIFRSSISGRFDNYDGSGNQARVNWELKFARGGVGAIVSSFVPVAIRGRILPNYATIDRDDRIPFWRELGKRVHEHDCKFIMQEQAGADAIHVSGGGYFPHPRNPVGHLPIEDFIKTYGTIIASGENTFRNYLLFHHNLTADVFKARWEKAAGTVYEGVNLADAHAIKQAVKVPVICTGGFQTASFIRSAISGGGCDAVSIARPLIANNDLVKQFAAGVDAPARPCTYCNKCLVNVVQNPLGCYDQTRFDSREDMIAQIMSVFAPPPFADTTAAGTGN